MPSVQEMCDIAARHDTAMAAAMVAACVAAGARTHPRGHGRARGVRPTESVRWARMVGRNSDTRWNHC